MLRQFTFASLVISLTLALSSCASPPPADTRIASVEGREVTYRVLGSGQPVLVMISGLGDGMDTFAEVAPRLAEHGTVIIYDRAGYGGSAAAIDKRDAMAADRELSALLAQSGVSGPYFVLGHSVGGLFAEYFAAHHADEIAGLVLEDSRPADFTQRCEASGVGMCTAPAALMWIAARGAQDEFASLSATTRQVEASRAHLHPTLVMTRSMSDNARDALWADVQHDLTARYPNGRLVSAPQGGHYVHYDAQDWFVSTVVAFTTRSGADA